MTQQDQGAGYVSEQAARDDQTEAGQSGAVTKLKRVASALRGDREDQPVTDETVPDQPVSGQPVPGQRSAAGTAQDELAMTSGDARDPGDQRLSGEPHAEGRPAPAGTAVAADEVPPADDRADPEYATTAEPIDRDTVRGPDSGLRDASRDDYRDGDRDQAATVDPTQPAADTTGLSRTGGTPPAAEYGNQAGTAAGYGEQAGTERDVTDSRGTTSAYGSPAETSSSYDTEAGIATSRDDRLAGTGSDQQRLTGDGPGVTEPAAAAGETAPAGVAGTGPAAVDATGRPTSAASTSAVSTSAEDAGLRPGEATERLGDFGDIAFGNLLPDADQYSTKWEQIQFRFVDDPQGSVTEAAEVIQQVTAKLESAIQERQRAIQDRQRAIQERASALRGRWGEGSKADTETLRETLRMYKSFMDQLVGPSS